MTHKRASKNSRDGFLTTGVEEQVREIGGYILGWEGGFLDGFLHNVRGRAARVLRKETQTKKRRRRNKDKTKKRKLRKENSVSR